MLVCVLPSLLILFGIDLGTARPPADRVGGSADPSDPEFYVLLLQGNFLHTLVEWTGVCVATMPAVFGGVIS